MSHLIVFSRYSVSMQLICDINKQFIMASSGFCGSSHDSYCFQQMWISQSPNNFFEIGQYLLADSAYASGTYIVPEYWGQALQSDSDNQKFNFFLSQSRVQIENSIGILKGRWSSLHEMWHQIKDQCSFQELVDWAISCVILHNMLAKIGDGWADLYEENSDTIPDPYILDTSLISNNSTRELIKPFTLNRH